jgi:hypothetical protein
MIKISFFHKQSIGFAALASVRDWAILSIIIVGVLGLRAALLLWSHMDRHDLQFAFIGGGVGMLPSILMCLPVHGVVDDLSRDAFHSFLNSMKFTRRFERNGTQFYTQNTPRLMRWDSNRVVVKSLPNGQLSVSMPFYCYRFLKRWS